MEVDPMTQKSDPLTFRWNFGDGSPVSTEESPTHTYASEGNFNVALDIFDGQHGDIYMVVM